MRIFQSLAAVVFLLLAFNIAAACSCAPNRPPCNYYGGTDTIFLGRVVGSKERKTITDNDGNKVTYDVGTIRFLVQENFKGVPGYEVEIHSGTGGGDCGYWFLRNESYIVYAFRLPDGKLMTSICSRTRLVAYADDDLEYLRSLTAAKPGGTLYGRLVRIIGDTQHGPFQEGPKLVGVKVVVTGEGKTIETLTNDAGEYRVTGLAPGKYDAFPQLPDNLHAASSLDQEDDFGRFTGREPIPVTDRACAEVNFSVQFSGSVSGKVVDSNGEPVKEAQINLVWGDDSEKDWWTWTDKDGYYEFVRVQPGSYLLGFNLRWAPDTRDPYPKTYYPGVKTRSEASLITVGEGEKLKGYDMTLPSRLSKRDLKVTVVWPDGRPAVGVDVRYEMNEATTNGEDVDTDAKGQATLSLFDNYHYIIRATAERNEKDFHSPPIEIFVNKSLKPLKLVLSKDGYGWEESDALKRKSPN